MWGFCPLNRKSSFFITDKTQFFYFTSFFKWKCHMWTIRHITVVTRNVWANHKLNFFKNFICLRFLPHQREIFPKQAFRLMWWCTDTNWPGLKCEIWYVMVLLHTCLQCRCFIFISAPLNWLCTEETPRMSLYLLYLWPCLYRCYFQCLLPFFSS